VRAILRTARQIFDLALHDRQVNRNPVASAHKPTDRVEELTGDQDDDRGERHVAVQEHEVFLSDEIARLTEHASAPLWKMLIATRAATGLMPQAALSFKWFAIEMSDEPRVFVRRFVSWARGRDDEGALRPKFFRTKTKAEYLEIPLAVELVPQLKAWKLQALPSRSDLVFSDKLGRPWRRSTVSGSGMRPACRRAGLRELTLKNLRHSFASNLLRGNAPIAEVSMLMGHTVRRTTRSECTCPGGALTPSRDSPLDFKPHQDSKFMANESGSSKLNS